MNEDTQKPENGETADWQVKGDFFKLKINRREIEQVPFDRYVKATLDIDLEFVVEDDDGNEAKFVALRCEAEEIVKTIQEALATTEAEEDEYNTVEEDESEDEDNDE
jgi:hypothetical protein